MKLKIVFIAVLLALIATPAIAEDITFFPSQTLLKDDKGVVVELDRVVISDEPRGYSIFNYPPEQYQFYTLYYHLTNPTDALINYQFIVTVVDQDGRHYASEEFNLAEGVDSGSRIPRTKEFAVYRNTTEAWLEWKHIDRELNVYEYTNINLTQEILPTATPVPTSTPYPVVEPTVTPGTVTATPAPTRGPGACLPFLPAGILIGGFGLVGIMTRRSLK